MNWVLWTPMWTVVGLNQFCLIGSKRGIHNYLLGKIALQPLLMYIEQYKPHTIFLLPPMLNEILSDPAGKKYNLSSVNGVTVSGSPLRQPVCGRFEAFMPNNDCRVFQGRA